MTKNPTRASLPKLLAALALTGLFAHTTAQAAVENYRVTGDYNYLGSTGTFTLDFGLDLSASPDSTGRTGADETYAAFHFESLSLSFSGGGVPVAPSLALSSYKQWFSESSQGTWLDLTGDDGVSGGTLAFSGEFTSFTQPKILGALFDDGYLRTGNFSDVFVGNISSVGFPSAAPVPEPEGYALMLAGLAALGAAARRQRAVR